MIGRPFTALIMAGSRAGVDPLAQAARVSCKALVPIAGETMLERVVRALRSSGAIGRIVVCGLPAGALDTVAPLRALHSEGRLELVEGAGTPSRSALRAVDALGDAYPLLVTSADHPLLSAEIVAAFCSEAGRLDCDLAVGLTPALPVEATFPGVRRTSHRFRGGAYCGCNLYGLLTPASRRAPERWVEVEEHRKRPWRMISALGVLALLRYLLGLLSLDGVIALASKEIGIRVQPVLLAQPEAGFDIDSIAHLRAAEEYLRSSGARAARG